MDALQFNGVLVYVGEVQQIKTKSGNLFVKRDIAIADDPEAKYPTILVGTLKKGKERDMTTRVSAQDINKPVSVNFYPEGRFYNDKQTGERKAMSGNSITKITFGESTAPAPAEPSPEHETVSYDEAADDMPF